MTAPAAEALRRILRSQSVDELCEVAERTNTARAGRCSPGALLDFSLGVQELSQDQTKAIVRALWFGGVELRDGALYVKRAYGLEPVVDGTLLGPYADEIPSG